MWLSELGWEQWGANALLLGAVGVLWRALQQKDELLQQAMQQLSEQARLIEDVPEALDRLRTEVLQRLDHLSEHFSEHYSGTKPKR